MRISREFVHALIGVGVAGIVARNWLIQGLVVPVVVTSGSMAPHLLGPHLQMDCAHCGHAFACDADSLPNSACAICPNCGSMCESSAAVDRPGDRVLVDRSAFLWRSPRRWEAVVFRTPGDPGSLAVKRVAGLPGESVQLCGGDVLVNGAIVTKDIADQRATAIGVYELPHGAGATDEVLKRWRAEPRESWRYVDGGFVHHALLQQSAADVKSGWAAPVDWLNYHHRQCFRSSETSEFEPILDDSSYDPNESRVLNPIADVILRCRITASPGSTVCLRVSSGGDLFTIELDPDRARAELVHNQTTAATTALPCESLRRGATLDLVLADHRLTLAVDDRPILAYRYQPFGAGSEVQPSRVAIGARGPEVKLRDLQILRDIYYTTGPDPGGETAGTYRLGPDEYFLLGDNSPHSLDSRVWSSHSAVTAPLIVGRALKW